MNTKWIAYLIYAIDNIGQSLGSCPLGMVSISPFDWPFSMDRVV